MPARGIPGAPALVQPLGQLLGHSIIKCSICPINRDFSRLDVEGCSVAFPTDGRLPLMPDRRRLPGGADPSRTNKASPKKPAAANNHDPARLVAGKTSAPFDTDPMVSSAHTTQWWPS
jgi:hypothetical protein